jgi:predicted Zn-dependent protease
MDWNEQLTIRPEPVPLTTTACRGAGRGMLGRRPIVLLVAALATLAACATNPVTGKSELDLIGERQEIAMGAKYFSPSIQESLGRLDDAGVQALVGRIGATVAAVGHRPALPYEFAAVNDPSANAFALPGGKICITRGLLSRLESEDGLAAVLGHEVGHVTARHVVQAYNRQLLAGIVMVGASVYAQESDSRYRGLAAVGAVVGSELVLAHYSREQERQADGLGLEYAVKAGYSPAGMLETQKILLELGSRKPNLVERLFATHPMSAERLATAEARVAKLPAEVRARPLRTEPYRAELARVKADQPAWDLAQEGRDLLAKDKAAEAEARLAKAIRLAPNTGVLHALHAASLTRAGRKAEAAAEAREGARLAPDVFVTRYLAGQAMLESDPPAALEHLAAAEKILPGQAAVAYFTGRADEALKRMPDAVEAYRLAVSRDPDGDIGKAAAARLQALGATGSQPQR